MTDPRLAHAKAVVRAFQTALDAAPAGATAAAIAPHTVPEMRWRCVHPFGVLHGAEAATRVWDPLKAAFRRLHRRKDLVFAGTNEIDGGATVWVVAMEHFAGLFDAPWLGLRPTGKLTLLRSCSFFRVEGAQIADVVLHFDIPHLMAQTGQSPFASQTGADVSHLTPNQVPGWVHTAGDPAESAATLARMGAMGARLGQWRSGLPLEEELRHDWHEDMVWWGPAGIGATFTIDRYAAQHARPFRTAFSDRSPSTHIARLAEGTLGGFFGWPNFTARMTGDFLGVTATGQVGEFRVIDVYRREGDLLAENWVFIDLLHFLHTQGIDVMPADAEA